MTEEMQYRIEKDFLGEKKIPMHSYYGIQTMRAVENFRLPAIELIRL